MTPTTRYWLGWGLIWAVSHVTLGLVVYFAVRSALREMSR